MKILIFKIFIILISGSNGFQFIADKLSKDIRGFQNAANYIVQSLFNPIPNRGIPNSPNAPYTQQTNQPNSPEPSSCKSTIGENLQKEIQSYRSAADVIIAAVMTGPFKGRSFTDLANMTDNIGGRMVGSEGLHNAVEFIMDKMKKYGLENVKAEDVPINVNSWVRGEEHAMLLTPRKKKLAVLGLGNTVGTAPSGIEAPVLVVRSFSELENHAAQAVGKIVVFNQPFTGYDATIQYQYKGAVKASQAGAVASLIRSVTPFSLNTPHTGEVMYDDNVTRIPTAAITVEDAELLDRLQGYGKHVTVKLVLDDSLGQPKSSKNTFAEIRGREKPDKVVVLSGHLDSWDVGQGAVEAAGGVVSMEALAVLKYLKMTPRRTIKTILWTGEEFGYHGTAQYSKDHKGEVQNIVAFFESAHGVFKPFGLDFAGNSDKAACIVKEVVSLLQPLNATWFQRKPKVGKVISRISRDIPGISLNTWTNKYYWYRHTEADTMTALNSHEMDLSTAVWAIASYVVADLSVELPRN